MTPRPCRQGIAGTARGPVRRARMMAPAAAGVSMVVSSVMASLLPSIMSPNGDKCIFEGSLAANCLKSTLARPASCCHGLSRDVRGRAHRWNVSDRSFESRSIA